MITVIQKIHEVLNLIKDFQTGYSSKTVSDGYMLISYKDKRYAVKLVEIENPSENSFDDLDRIHYML